MQTVPIGSLNVSRFTIGGNPLSGFSHLDPETSTRMRHYFTASQIKRLLRDAESAGVNTLFARADRHITRVLLEYWDEGGQIQWLAQTCPELGAIKVSVQNAIDGGAKACYVHGGVMDHLLAQGGLDEVSPAIEMIKAAGMPAGVAGHIPDVFQWAEREIDVDFYMCCHYNPTWRVESPHSGSGGVEHFGDEDRHAMAKTIATLSKPVIHYKVLAAGRNDPAEAFAFVARHMRPQDAVCVGIYDEDNPDMLREDIELLETGLAARL